MIADMPRASGAGRSDANDPEAVIRLDDRLQNPRYARYAR
jgi:hypothetical protein